jgi:hypothetical protein
MCSGGSTQLFGTSLVCRRVVSLAVKGALPSGHTNRLGLVNVQEMRRNFAPFVFRLRAPVAASSHA